MENFKHTFTFFSFFLILIFQTNFTLAQDYGLDFNGNNQYVNCGSVVVTGASPRTVEAWAYTRAFNGGAIWTFGTPGGTNGEFTLRTHHESNNRWVVQLWGEDFDFDAWYSLNNWVHFAFVYDGVNVIVYVDGNYVTQQPRTLTTNAGDFLIGKWNSGGAYFNGKIDEVRVWNTARTQSEIRGYMNIELVGNEPGLMAYYQMNESTGSIINDNSSNSYHGNLINSPVWFVSGLFQPIGSGTSGDPYRIGTFGNLIWVSKNSSEWSKYYIQTGNIDAFTSHSMNSNGAGEFYGWLPIGNLTLAFSGNYNGYGFTISNLFCNRSSQNIGIFARVTNATIKNLNVENCDITGSNYAGGLTGYSILSTIDNCSISGTISGVRDVGGIVGGNGNTSSILNCFSSGTVTSSDNSSNQNFGGIAGTNWGQILNSGSSSNIVASNKYCVGGIIGFQVSGLVENCYSTGNISGSTQIGGLIGYLTYESAPINNCYSTGQVSGISSLGGLVGAKYSTSSVTNSFWDTATSGLTVSDGGVGKTTNEMKNYSTFTIAGWDFKGESANGTNEIWNIGNGRNDGYPYLCWQYPNDNLPFTLAPAGEGTIESPYQIAIWQNLSWIAENASRWSAHYIQTTDINLANAIPSITAWDNGAGWTPIGNESTKFTGTYNGQGHTIDGLYINRTANHQAMFGYTAGATIQNLGLTNVNITNYGNVVGALVAYNGNSLISNCYSTGTVTCTVGWDTGGLIGANDDNSRVTNCYSTCTVSGDGNTGGLVGWNVGGSSIIESYSTGNVASNTNVSHIHTGGLVGLMQTSTIEKSYSTGNVTGKDNAGAFVGSAYSSTIRNCYSLGDVTRASESNSFFGGFVGYNSSSLLECCYSTAKVFQSATVSWSDGTKGFVGGSEGINTYTANYFDAELSNQSSATGATPKTTDQMKVYSTYPGWSNTIWYMDALVNSGYPYLSWQSNEGSPLPVELTSFTAKLSSEGVALNWQTATELNNYGFEIQRQTSNVKSGKWEEVGFVGGHGNSNSPKDYSFEDINYIKGVAKYRLKQIDIDGAFEYSNIVEVKIEIPTKFDLSQNYPNPFNPSTIINYSIPKAGLVKLYIYNLLGELVAELVNEKLEAGFYQHSFNANSASGGLSSGIYFYTITVDEFREVKKMNFVK